MQTLRHAHLLARFVLVWFVCALGVAVASPMVHAQALELVCSSGGAVKLLVKTDNGVQEMGAHSLDCPLCLVGGAPPPQATPTAAAPVQPLAYVLRSIPAARLAARTAAPLPARGAPTLFAIKNVAECPVNTCASTCFYLQIRPVYRSGAGDGAFQRVAG